MRYIFTSCALRLALAFLAVQSAAAQDDLIPYSIGNPTNDQQYVLALMNRARADADAEAVRLGLSSRQEGPPNYNGEPWTIQNSTQPLSWNAKLAEAAQNHSKTLNDGDQFFSGLSPHTYGGATPAQRIKAANYSETFYTGPKTQPTGYYPGEENIAEQVTQGSGPFSGPKLTAATLAAQNDLFADRGVAGRGHRNTMTLGFFREVGVGITAGTDANQGSVFESFYLVEDFGTDLTGAGPFITGVVFNDANHNGFYDPGEGVAGVRVDVPGARYYALSSSSGGYSIPVQADGVYTVNFTGRTVPGAQRSATIANSLNVKVDYMTSNPRPAVRLANISTRVRVETGDDILIGGFIVTGTQAKKLMLRAIGPSLPFATRLPNPTLQLIRANGVILESNDDWRQSPNAEAISASGIPPGNALESAIVRTVQPGVYTATVSGIDNTAGVGLVEVYDLDGSTDSKLANISTRGRVQSGEDVMIAGAIVLGSTPQKVIVRAIGPSLSVPGKLGDPTLELRDRNGAIVMQNDDWRSAQEAEIIATQIPPSDNAEAAIVATLQPAPYTAVVRGAGGATGVAIVEVYALSP